MLIAFIKKPKSLRLIKMYIFFTATGGKKRDFSAIVYSFIDFRDVIFSWLNIINRTLLFIFLPHKKYVFKKLRAKCILMFPKMKQILSVHATCMICFVLEAVFSLMKHTNFFNLFSLKK